MASYVNTDGFQKSRYFARSWALLTREPGWIKRLLILWLAILAPIVGLAGAFAYLIEGNLTARDVLPALLFWLPLLVLIVGSIGVAGYIAEWGRLTAWGVPSSPARSGGTVGAYLRTGGRNLVIGVVWGLSWLIFAGLAIETPLVGELLSWLLKLLSFPFTVIMHVILLRATIYQSISGGFKASAVLKMIERDPMGLLRILGIQLVGSLLVGVIVTIVLTVLIGLIPETAFPGNLAALARMSPGLALGAAVILIFVAIPAILISLGVASLVWITLEIVVFNAVGLWMRQFNVPAWGGSDDPLPASLPAYAPAQHAPYNPYAADTPPGQVPYAYGDTDYGLQTQGGVGQTQAGPQEGPQNRYPQS